MSEINGPLNSQLAEKGQPNDGLRQLKPMTADEIVHRAAKSILDRRIPVIRYALEQTCGAALP
jgi:hypothetical protein